MSKWEMVRLGDVCNLNMGQSPSSSSYNEIGEGLPFYQGNADFGELYPVVRYYCSAPNKIALPNDILLSVRAPIGALNIAKEECCIGRGLAALTPGDNLEMKYLYYILKDNHAELNAKGTGSTFKAINKSNLCDFEIPLPPLAIQQQIARTLDTAAALLALRKKQLAELDALIQSVFIEMFGDPVVNEKGWELKKLEDITDCIVPGRDKPKSFTGDIPWITTKDLILGNYTFASKNKLGLSVDEIEEVNAKIIPAKSVILCCVGDIGIASISGCDFVMNQQLHSFQCSDILNPIYLCVVLPYYKNQMLKMATSTTVLYMNKRSCNAIRIILPPITLQTKFADIVKKIEQQKALVQQAIDESLTLFESLMAEYFE